MSAGISPPLRRVVVYLPLQKEITYKISQSVRATPEPAWRGTFLNQFSTNTTAVKDSLPHYFKGATEDDTLVVSLYTPEIQTALSDAYLEELKKHQIEHRVHECLPPYDENYFGREISIIPQEKDWYLDWDQKLPDRFNGLVDHFNCQQGDRPLTRFQLRRAFILRGIYYNKRADRQARASFARARVLGVNLLKNPMDEGLLPDERDVKIQQGLWVEYSQAVNEFERNEKRIPVRFRNKGFPAPVVYLDGDPVEVGELTITPPLLYSGQHFIQAEDTLGRIRSDTFIVSETTEQVGIGLGENGLLTPTNAETEQLLWLNLQRKIAGLPTWLSRALVKYAQSMGDGGVELYIAAPWEGWDQDAGGELYVAGFDSIHGLVELADERQGKNYHSLRAAQASTPTVLSRKAWSAGGGIAQLGTHVFGRVEGDWTVSRSDSIDARLGLTWFHHGAQLQTLSPMAALWGGVLHEPATRNLGSIYGVSIGAILPGFAPAHADQPRSLLVRPFSRAFVGVGFPFWKGSARFELSVAPSLGFDALQTGLGPFELMVEGLLAFRPWAPVPVRPALFEHQEMNP